MYGSQQVLVYHKPFVFRSPEEMEELERQIKREGMDDDDLSTPDASSDTPKAGDDAGVVKAQMV